MKPMLRKFIISLAALFSIGANAQISPASCAPSPFGAGSQAIYKWPTKGAFVAWWCPNETKPTLYVCAKRVCGLVGSQRAVADLLSNPTLANLNSAAKGVPSTWQTDPELIEVWSPYYDDIAALKPRRQVSTFIRP